MVRPAAGAYNIAVRRAPEGLHAVEGLDELLTILKGHTGQAGGEAVGRAGVGGEDADAVEVAGGPEGVRVDEVVVAHAVHDVVALVVAAGDESTRWKLMS